jgi:hypothetical protein
MVTQHKLMGYNLLGFPLTINLATNSLATVAI